MKAKWLILMLCALCLGHPSELLARSKSKRRRSAPALMVSRSAGTSSRLNWRATPRSVYRRKRENTLLSLELGTQGRKSNASSELFGMNLLFGLRVAGLWALTDVIVIKPSLGYFRDKESTAQASVTTQIVEGGVSAFYRFRLDSSTAFMAGLAQRLDYIFSTIALKDVSDTGGSLFRYRVGPAVSMQFKVNEDTYLAGDLELTFPIASESTAQAAAMFGIVFSLD